MHEEMASRPSYGYSLTIPILRGEAGKMIMGIVTASESTEMIGWTLQKHHPFPLHQEVERSAC